MGKPKSKAKRGARQLRAPRATSGRSADAPAGDEHAAHPAAPVEPVAGPLRAARILSGLILLLGLMMLVLGGGIAAGRITDGWGFPMSAVPNWGRPWGAVLMLAAAAYIGGPILLFARPQAGSIVMLIVSGLSVLVGTPLITTTTEIFYNLFQEAKSRPDWVDSVWGCFMIVNVAIAIAVYRAYPTPGGEKSKHGNVEKSKQPGFDV